MEKPLKFLKSQVLGSEKQGLFLEKRTKTNNSKTSKYIIIFSIFPFIFAQKKAKEFASGRDPSSLTQLLTKNTKLRPSIVSPVQNVPVQT